MAEQIFFFVFAILAVGSAIAVVSLRNPVHSVISLMVCFLQMAALFVMLRSPFIAVVQVFVYVGAVLVLFLFVIMMLDIAKAGMERFVSGGQLWVIALLGVLLLETITTISMTSTPKRAITHNCPPETNRSMPTVAISSIMITKRKRTSTAPT